MIWALVAAAALFGPMLVILAGVGVGEWWDRQRTREDLERLWRTPVRTAGQRNNRKELS